MVRVYKAQEGVGKSPRRTKRRAILSGIREGGERKTKQSDICQQRKESSAQHHRFMKRDLCQEMLAPFVLACCFLLCCIRAVRSNI